LNCSGESSSGYHKRSFLTLLPGQRSVVPWGAGRGAECGRKSRRCWCNPCACKRDATPNPARPSSIVNAARLPQAAKHAAWRSASQRVGASAILWWIRGGCCSWGESIGPVCKIPQAGNGSGSGCWNRVSPVSLSGGAGSNGSGRS
jgi:hypothetical protein